MCGIAGFAAFEDADQSKLKVLATLMGLEMENRGRQSWGWFSGEDMEKGTGNLAAGLVLPEVMPSNFVLHTRHATHGGVSVDNAHPFAFQHSHGDLVGCHNGVISNHHDLNEQYHRKFAVDSQHIFQHILDGNGELSDLQGYGAVVFRREQVWYYGTFNNGDLNVANTGLGKVFASTSFAVKQACHMAGVEIFSWDQIQDNNMYRFDPRHSYEAWRIDAHGTRQKWNDSSFTAASNYNRGGWQPKKKETQKEEVDFSSSNALETSDNYFEGAAWSAAKGKWIKVLHMLPPPSLPTLECQICMTDIETDRYYKDGDDPVCLGCAQDKYHFLGVNDYILIDGATTDWTCDLCSADQPAFYIRTEAMAVCGQCFNSMYTVTGLEPVKLEETPAS